MFVKEPRNISYLASVSFHLILAIIFLFVTLNSESNKEEYLLIGFGSGSGMGSPAVSSINENANEKPVPEKIEKKNEQKKIELPKSKQTDENNFVAVNKKTSKDETKDSKIKPLTKGNATNKEGEQEGTGGGGFGFELDFGGKGMRRIYSYNLPEYPEGVAKEIDVKLRFTILPDGTVSNIVPLIKADARLELAAINSLKNWRFEPLPLSAKQINQNVVITFPYRLQ